LIYPDNATRYLNSQERAQNATAVRAIVSTPEVIMGRQEGRLSFRNEVSHYEPSLARAAGTRSPATAVAIRVHHEIALQIVSFDCVARPEILKRLLKRTALRRETRSSTSHAFREALMRLRKNALRRDRPDSDG
jgi:hypothetical protein